MELKPDDVRKLLASRHPADMVFLVPLADDDSNALMIKSIGGGDEPMVITKEYNGNERSLSWKSVCEQHEIAVPPPYRQRLSY